MTCSITCLKSKARKLKSSVGSSSFHSGESGYCNISGQRYPVGRVAVLYLDCQRRYCRCDRGCVGDGDGNDGDACVKPPGMEGTRCRMTPGSTAPS